MPRGLCYFGALIIEVASQRAHDGSTSFPNIFQW